MQSYFHKNISHIYVEKDAYNYPLTNEILSKFRNAIIIEIDHYKDVFNRANQDYIWQKNSQKLILAVNKGQLIYEGAPVCQDFGNDRFFYSASAMNCLFDCDYCFLKGMYATSNMVIFVNFEDYVKEVERFLADGPMYLCVSYDTDLLAINGFSKLADKWIEFASQNENLTIEIRTKSTVFDFTNNRNIIYAFTLSPREIISKFEHGTSNLDMRLKSVNKAIESGARTRLCLDPLIYVRDFEVCYNKFCDEIISSIDFSRIQDVSIGAFRISKDYIKQLRKMTSGSEATEFPFVNVNGYCMYPPELENKMINLVRTRISEVFDEKRIY